MVFEKEVFVKVLCWGEFGECWGDLLGGVFFGVFWLCFLWCGDVGCLDFVYVEVLLVVVGLEWGWKIKLIGEGFYDK